MLVIDKRRCQRASFMHGPRLQLLVALAAAIALSMIQSQVLAAPAAKSGKEVVETVCAACHGTGAKGAPKIGDKNAWSKLSSQGLTSLTQNALNGIRQMPSHGGNPGLSDFEIERAITYMVNQSGGHWSEPIDKASPPGARTGEQIVRAQCAKCHETGVGGAPKIGDRAAWIPRLKQGLDNVVRSAINGHGGMPARGGMADLTDPEIRSAVIFLVNAGAESKPSPSAPVATDQDYQVVEGVTAYLGVVSSATVREQQKDYPASVYGAAPPGPGEYYVTIALFEAKGGGRITDATVRARVVGTAEASSEKTLQGITVAGSLTYGNYFAMPDAGTYKITVRISRPGAVKPVEVQFLYKRP
jgi:cytochrome c5